VLLRYGQPPASHGRRLRLAWAAYQKFRGYDCLDTAAAQLRTPPRHGRDRFRRGRGNDGKTTSSSSATGTGGIKAYQKHHWYDLLIAATALSAPHHGRARHDHGGVCVLVLCGVHRHGHGGACVLVL
jgi:hypothetical protein